MPVRVPLRTLADVVPRTDWPRLRLVKVDVEGFESDVLAGLEPILAAGHRPAVAVEVHRGHRSRTPASSVADLARRYGLALARILEHPGAERRGPRGTRGCTT